MIVDINRIDLQVLDKDELERVKLMLDINKIQADIEATRQSINESQASVEQMKINTAKMQKEMMWFPLSLIHI